jgi:DNA-binding NarL/FixJ family response regulator
MPDAASALRIAIVDDHPVAQYGVQFIVGSEPGLDVVAATDAIAVLWSDWPDPDVVVLDLYLRDGRVPGAEVTRLAERCPVLMMSASARREDVISAIRAGGAGYLVKSATSDVFVDAIRTVAAGGFYVSSQLADLISAAPDRSEPPESQVLLAPRERETLALIAQGFTQTQAARRMGLSPATIDTYIRRIRRKFGGGNKADLTRRAIELGEVPPGPVS